MRQIADTITIASICPFPLDVLARPYSPAKRGGTSRFHLPEYTLKEHKQQAPPKLLVIEDCFQAEPDVFYPNRPPARVEVIPVETICTDILTHWSRPDIGCDVGSTGVFRCEGEKPSPDEIHKARVALDEYARWLYGKAYELWQQNKVVEISRKHRLAANLLGFEEPWAKMDQASSGRAEFCPLCKSSIPSGVIVCPTCTRQIRDMPADLAKFNAAAVPVVPKLPQQPNQSQQHANR